jgi:hypothetical protein
VGGDPWTSWFKKFPVKFGLGEVGKTILGESSVIVWTSTKLKDVVC